MKTRNLTIDLARLFAAYGVIALHVPSATDDAEIINTFFWPICVPFFYLTSLTYFINGVKGFGRKYYSRNWTRLVLPYFFWSSVYIILLVIKHLQDGGDFKIVWWRAILYGESAVHLYFIPTLLLMQSVGMSLYLLFNGDKRDRVISFIILAISIIYFVVGVTNNCYGMRSTGNLIEITLFLLTAFWAASYINKKENKWRILVTVVGGLLLLFSLVCNFSKELISIFGYPLIFPLGGIGFYLIVIVNHISRLPAWLIYLTSFSYGIYLCHIVFLESYEVVCSKILHLQVVNNFPIKLFEVTLIFLTSIVFVFTIRKNRTLRKLVIGEK